MRNAIFLSTAIHISLIGLVFSGDGDLLRRIAAEKMPMTVDYFVLTEEGKTARPERRTEVRIVKASAAQNPASETGPAAAAKPAADAARREGVNQKVSSRRTDVEELARKQAEIKSTKEYAGYFEILREKIRQRLKSNYKNYHGEGEVRIVFILRRDGSLAAVECVDGTDYAPDAILAEIAISSMREAAPFPRFPDAVSLPQMSFNLTVSFRKE